MSTPKTPKPWGDTAVVGKPLPRVDAYERVTGSAVFTRDFVLPRMLHGAILRCPHPHALVKKVDTSKAERMPGVRAVLTNADPDANIPWYSHPTTNKALSRLFDPHCRFEGEEVAAVAAETPQQALDALRAIAVEYRELPFVTDMEKALAPNAPAVHEGGNLAVPVDKMDRGDVAKGFAEADVVVETSFRTACEIHSPMETHGSVALWEGRRLTVWDSTQGVFEVQPPLAQALKMPLSDVRVIGHYVGGGFGSKCQLGKYTVIAALLAKKAGRPVKVFLTREDNFRAVGNRPPHIIALKAGAKKDGTLTALQLTAKSTIGAYPETVFPIGGQIAELYRCPNIHVEESQIYINAGQCRAFRAPSYPPCSWALEQTMDALAGKLGMDPIDLRLKNITTISQTEDGNPYTSTGLSRCLREGAAAFGWKEGRVRARSGAGIVRGIGVAVGMWDNPGGPPSTAIVKVFPDGSANLNMGAADLGTGTKTIMAQIVSEELGIPVEKIQIEYADTGTTQFTYASAGSKTVPSDCPAVRGAALEAKAQLLELAAAQLKLPADGLELKDGAVRSTAEPGKMVALAKLRALADQGVVVGVGYRGPNVQGKAIRPFAVNFAEVEVNLRTGEMRVLRMLGAHDSGRVMNLRTYENQVFGGITMSIGYAATERRVLDEMTGKLVNGNLHTYKLPTAKDVPEDLTCLPIDPHDTECNTVGAKGIGEPAHIPGAAAIANAFYNATGVRVTETPIRPSQVLRLLEGRKG